MGFSKALCKFTRQGVAVLLFSMSVSANAYWEVGANANMSDVNGAASHGYGIFGGFNLSNYIAFHAAFQRLGEDGRSGILIPYDSLSILVQPALPMRWGSLYGNIGTHIYSGEGDTAAQLVYGFGASLQLNPRVKLSSEYNFYNIQDTDIEALSLKVSYLF